MRLLPLAFIAVLGGLSLATFAMSETLAAQTTNTVVVATE